MNAVFLLKDMIATGGIDTNAVVFDRPSGQIVSTLSGHSKKVSTQLCFCLLMSN